MTLATETKQSRHIDSAIPDRQAMAFAREHTGGISWLSILFPLLVSAAYLALLGLSVLGHVSVGWAVFGLSALSYALYTPLHESVHNNISGSQNRGSWIDSTIGSVTGMLMGSSYTMHKAAHLAHHSKINNQQHDPDMVFGEGKLHQVLLGCLVITLNENKWYFKHKWPSAPTQDKALITIELFGAIVLRVGIAVAGYPIEALLFSVLPSVLGAMFTAFIFAWLVHRPHQTEKRYLNTSTFVFNRWLDTPITCLWLFQNYHSIHHLFPRVPFHQYRKVFRKIETIMREKSAPIYQF